MADPTSSADPPVIRAVIFDMDGVLTDSEPLINAAAIAMFQERGLVVQPEDFLPFVGAGENRYIGGVAEKYAFPIDLPAAKARTYQLYLELVPTRLKAFPGAVELVRACRGAGLRVAVASSADRIKIEANLRQIGIPWEEFDAVVNGEEVADKKPAPDIFLAAARRLGLEPGQCVVVEDAVNGIEAAKAARMKCVAVAQTFPADALGHADLVRPNVLELSLSDLIGEPQPNTATDAAPATDAPSAASKTAGASAIRPWGLWATIGLSVLVMLAAVFAQMIVLGVWLVATRVLHGRTPSPADSIGLLFSMAGCAAAPVMFGLSYLFARWRSGARAFEYLGFRFVPVQAVALWAMALIGLIVASDGLTLALGRPIVPTVMLEAFGTAGSLPLFAFALIIAAPLGEETLFRGFLFEGVLRSKWGATGAILTSSITWALIHIQYDFYGIATIFVSGLFLGFVRLRTGSIFVTALLHALMNFIALAEMIVWVRFKS